MPRYRVKPGFRHGMGKRYGPGDTVEHTEAEAAGFLDKLELVEEAEPEPAQPDTDAGDEQTETDGFDVSQATVDEVIAAVKDGRIAAEDALEAEQAGKQRVSLLSWLLAELDKPE